MTDVNKAAHATVRAIIAQSESKRNPAAVAMGRLGLKGGKARAAALSPKKRSEIARAAARNRWATS